jgi:hypothetical protein
MRSSQPTKRTGAPPSAAAAPVSGSSLSREIRICTRAMVAVTRGRDIREVTDVFTRAGFDNREAKDLRRSDDIDR